MFFTGTYTLVVCVCVYIIDGFVIKLGVFLAGPAGPPF
jgi:hypothetical protein